MNKFFTILLIITLLGLTLGTYHYYTYMQNTITIGYLPTEHDSALFVADYKNMYQSEGINVRLVPYSNGADMVKGLKSGQIDVGYCGVVPVISAVGKGDPLKIIASVNEEGSAIVVKKGSNITNISDLKNKRIAVPNNGSVQAGLLDYVLLENNITLNDVNITEVESSYMTQDLALNKIDAFMGWEPYPSTAEYENVGTVLEYSGDIWNKHPCCVIVTTENYSASHTAILKKFLEVHSNATDYVNNHKDETAEIVSKKLGTNEEVIDEGLKHIQFDSNLSTTFVDNVMKFVYVQQKLGYLKNNLTESQLFNFDLT